MRKKDEVESHTVRRVQQVECLLRPATEMNIYHVQLYIIYNQLCLTQFLFVAKVLSHCPVMDNNVQLEPMHQYLGI